MLTLDEVRKRFLIWVVDNYHNKRHRGLNNATPLNMWRRLSGRMRAPLQINDEDLRLGLSLIVKSKIDGDGIVFNKIRYQSIDLGEYLSLIKRERPHFKPAVRLDPRDLKQICVRNFKGGWLSVPRLESNPDIVDEVNASQWASHLRQHRETMGPSPAEVVARLRARSKISRSRPTKVRGSGQMRDLFTDLQNEAINRPTRS